MTERSQRILSSSVVKCSGLDLSTPAASGMVTAEAAPQHRYALQQDDLVRKRFGGNGAKPPPPSAGRLVRGRSESCTRGLCRIRGSSSIPTLLLSRGRPSARCDPAVDDFVEPSFPFSLGRSELGFEVSTRLLIFQRSHDQLPIYPKDGFKDIPKSAPGGLRIALWWSRSLNSGSRSLW